MQPGKIERRSHDYYRPDTSTLFAALDIATGQVTAALKQRHRHQKFLAFLKVERAHRDVLDDAGQPVELHLPETAVNSSSQFRAGHHNS